MDIISFCFYFSLSFPNLGPAPSIESFKVENIFRFSICLVRPTKKRITVNSLVDQPLITVNYPPILAPLPSQRSSGSPCDKLLCVRVSRKSRSPGFRSHAETSRLRPRSPTGLCFSLKRAIRTRKRLREQVEG